MIRFFRKWCYRFVAYRVTIKYLGNPNCDPSHDIVKSIEHINMYVKNVTLKKGLKKDSA